MRLQRNKPLTSKILRALDRVYPGATFLPEPDQNTSRNWHGLGLWYVVQGNLSRVLAVYSAHKSVLPFLAMRCAFFRLGFETRWIPKFPGRFEFTPVKDYMGPEKLVPIELDPDLSPEQIEVMKLEAYRAMIDQDRKALTEDPIPQ